MASGGSSIYLGSDDCSIECDVCKFRGIKSQAISYCNECTEAFCSVCDEVHGASKKSRNHKLLTGDQMPSISDGSQITPPLMMCDKHQLKIEYLCKDDNAVMCSTCKMTSHRKCNTIEISTHTATNDPRKPFSSMQGQLKKLEVSYKNLHQRRNRDKTKLKVQIQNCIEEVKNVRKHVEKRLLTLEKKMMAELKDVQDKINKEIEEQLTLASNTTRQIQDMIASINECQKTGQRDVMFVGLKKTEREIQDYDTLINDLEKELNDIDIHFKPDEFFTTSLNELQSIGRLTELVCSQDVADVSVLDLTINKERVHDVGCSFVSSVVFLPDGHVVLACGKDGLILMDEEFRQQSKLLMKASKACRTSDTEVLVSQYEERQLSFVDILPKMTTKTVLNIGALCLGVDYYNGEIYVSCRVDLQVRVLGRNGNVNRRLGVNDGQYMFRDIRDIKVNRTGDKIYIVDAGDRYGRNNSVTCMDQQGHVIYRYTDSNMVHPSGIYVDGHDNILLCGLFSCNVQVITAAGTKHKELVTLDEGLGSPLNEGLGHLYCISFRPSDGCLAIGVDNGDDHDTLVTYDCSA